MIYILTNAISILFATATGLILSVAYASLFKRSDGIARGGSVGLFIAAAVAEFWLACILAGALILAPQQAGAWTMAIGSAVVIWIGFVVPVLTVTEPFRGVSVPRTVADCLHWLAVMVLQAAVLHETGLVNPHG